VCQFQFVSTEGFTPVLCARCVPVANGSLADFSRAIAGRSRRYYELDQAHQFLGECPQNDTLVFMYEEGLVPRETSELSAKPLR